MDGYVAKVFTTFIDVPDKISVAVYFSGCSIRCKECHNKELWDKKNGTLMSEDELLKKLEDNKLAEYVVFLGGEPTDQMDFLIRMTDRVKKDLKKSVALYTGREFEVLPQELLNNLELIVCGPYKKEFHVGGWPASSNQRAFKKEGTKWLH